MYGVLFLDGAVKQYAANTTAQSIYFTLDSEGHSKSVLDCILERSKDDRVIDKADKYIHTKRGNKRLCKTIIGWILLVW